MSTLLKPTSAPLMWSARQIAEAEGIVQPSDLGLLQDLHELAALVAEAPPAMLDSAIDTLLELMGNIPPDVVFPILSEVMTKRPDAIRKAVAEQTRLGARVRHMERTVYVAALFCPERVKRLTAATARVVAALRGEPPEME